MEGKKKTKVAQMTGGGHVFMLDSLEREKLFSFRDVWHNTNYHLQFFKKKQSCVSSNVVCVSK